MTLVRRALTADTGSEPSEELLAKAYAFFLDYYREHKLDFTYAYDGVLEALAALRNVRDASDTPPRAMAVLTNKPVRQSAVSLQSPGHWRLTSSISTEETVSRPRSRIRKVSLH